MKRKNFLLLIQSPDLQPEHSRIADAVQSHSLGDFIEMFKVTSAKRGSRATGEATPFTLAYLFSTETPPSEMGFALLTGDSYFLVEIGTATRADGFSRVRAWMDRHRSDD